MTGYRITARGRWALAVPGFLLVVAGIVVAELLAAQTGAAPVRGAASATAVVHPAPGWPSVAATMAENARPGTAAWPLTDYTPGALDGWADHVSVHPGEAVQLYVGTAAASFTVQALRMGWYGGTRARLVWSTPQPILGIVAAEPTVSALTRTVSAAAWSPSLRVDTTGWLPGDYLFRLLGSDGTRALCH